AAPRRERDRRAAERYRERSGRMIRSLLSPGLAVEVAYEALADPAILEVATAVEGLSEREASAFQAAFGVVVTTYTGGLTRAELERGFAIAFERFERHRILIDSKIDAALERRKVSVAPALRVVK